MVGNEVLEGKTNQFLKAVQHNKSQDVERVLKEIKESLSSITPEAWQGKVLVNQLIHKKSGNTGLHLCATNGYLQLAKMLMNEGANLEQINFDGKTALHDAAQFGQLEMVEYLLQKGANVNVVKKADWTPLMLACTKPNYSVIETLLGNGADLKFVNKDGWNCIHIAAREGHTDILRLILSYAKNPQLRQWLCQHKSRNGRKPLHTSVMHGHRDVIKLLAEESTSEEINEEDNCGTTPVMDACRFGFTDVAILIVDNYRADLYKYNKQGLNCLHIAAEAGQVDVIRLLVSKYSMDVNSASENFLMSPLHWAAKEGQLDAVVTLLELHARKEPLNYLKRTPMDLALAFKHDSVIHQLSLANR